MLNNENINQEQKDRLLKLINEYADCFGTNYEHLSQTNLVEFHVDTADAKPIYKRPYAYMSHAEKEFLKQDLKGMVDNGILVPTTHVKGNTKSGGWSFPCRYVGKKTGDRRLISMFQDLNKVTVRDPWPLPNLVDVIEDLGKSQWYSQLDLLKGFHQIKVHPESCLPFGVLNGPSCFSRAIYLAMEPFINSSVTVYLDDCTVHSKTFDEHMEHLEAVFKRLLEVNMKLNANKVELFTDKIELLGFHVSPNGISPVSTKVDKMLNFSRPMCQKNVRAFVNLCGFYRRHIPFFSQISSKMNELLKKNKPFIRDNDCQESFEKLKKALVDAATLNFPDPKKPYRLYTDASDIAIGACLAQLDDNDEERPICFMSRKLQPAEFRKYLLDKPFTLFTDNSAVQYMFSKNTPNQRLQRWVMAAQDLTFKCVHLKTKFNPVADAMSRYPTTYEVKGDELNGEDDLEALYEHLM
ncbi:Retrovirus-related Pol polyprotein from transposon 17.6, partial [Choanephora cucurbitarum]